MSYTTKVVRDMFLEIIRDSDNHAVSLAPKKVWEDKGSTYQGAILWTDEDKTHGALPEGKSVGDVRVAADELPEGKKVGDVNVAAKGWQEEDYDWDAELTRIFGEVNSDVKSAITSAFTDTVKANYVKLCKGE